MTRRGCGSESLTRAWKIVLSMKITMRCIPMITVIGQCMCEANYSNLSYKERHLCCLDVSGSHDSESEIRYCRDNVIPLLFTVRYNTKTVDLIRHRIRPFIGHVTVILVLKNHRGTTLEGILGRMREVWNPLDSTMQCKKPQRI